MLLSSTSMTAYCRFDTREFRAWIVPMESTNETVRVKCGDIGMVSYSPGKGLSSFRGLTIAYSGRDLFTASETMLLP